MFTGIINGISNIISIEKKEKFHSYIIKMSCVLSQGLKIGDSVSHNGCCLTLKHIDNMYYTFDVMQETLSCTNLGSLKIGDDINIERSVKYGDDIGGHIVSGHIWNTVEVSKIVKFSKNYVLWLKVHDVNLMKYFFYRGFVCLDGISLTIGKIIKNEFCVYLIPETLIRTTIRNKKKGSLINLEIDLQTQIIVDTVERRMHKHNNYD